MKKIEIKQKGFTLVELVIVIAIVIILSVVSVPIYRGYTRNAKMAEGYALLATILSSQKSYYSEWGYFLNDFNSTAGNSNFTCNEPIFGIDARGNKYFTSFNIAFVSGEVGKYAVKIYTVEPEDLAIGGRSYLGLVFDITTGSRFIETASL